MSKIYLNSLCFMGTMSYLVVLFHPLPKPYFNSSPSPSLSPSKKRVYKAMNKFDQCLQKTSNRVNTWSKCVTNLYIPPFAFWFSTMFLLIFFKHYTNEVRLCVTLGGLSTLLSESPLSTLLIPRPMPHPQKKQKSPIIDNEN